VRQYRTFPLLRYVICPEDFSTEHKFFFADFLGFPSLKMAVGIEVLIVMEGDGLFD
jgi:hypothetical protein